MNSSRMLETISLLEQHIWKEDNVLFSLADQYIPVEVQIEIMNRFREFEEKEIGEEHEKQIRIIRRLKEAYLE